MEKVSNKKEIIKMLEDLKIEIEAFRTERKKQQVDQLASFDKNADIDDQTVIVQFQIKKFTKEDFEEEVQYNIEVSSADINLNLFERDFNAFIDDPKLIEVFSYELK